MIYLSEQDVKSLQPSWEECITLISSALNTMQQGNYSQPLKPYLKLNDPKNRIIAMPSYLGGQVGMAGIKWIASFPDNLEKGIPRAHSTTILNSPETGVPLSIMDSRLLSGIRTASVSGYFIHQILTRFNWEKITIGICGFGVIGRLHYQMLKEILGSKINQFYVYDQLGEIECVNCCDIRPTNCWQEAYKQSDIFITCTTTSRPYIDIPPPMGSLQLNISLRDYKPDILALSRSIIVDDWNEVCRENTDIYRAHTCQGLNKEDVISILELDKGDFLSNFSLKKFDQSDFIHFNPMGLSAFDIAIATEVYRRALKKGIGTKI